MTKIDWEHITNYIESVGSTDTNFPFTKPQSSVKVSASGAKANIIYTIGGQSGTLTPGQSVTVTGSISSMTLRSASGQQPFQVWAVEAGTEKDEPETDFASQLAQNVQQKGTTQSVIFNADGTVQKVIYKDSQNNIVGEDDFTYTSNLITETRTRGVNVTTYKYHLDTLETEVI